MKYLAVFQFVYVTLITTNLIIHIKSEILYNPLILFPLKKKKTYSYFKAERTNVFFSRIKRTQASEMFKWVKQANHRLRSVEGLHQQAKWIICTTNYAVPGLRCRFLTAASDAVSLGVDGRGYCGVTLWWRGCS